MSNIIKKYVEIFKSKKCSRKYYWLYQLFIVALFFFLMIINFIFPNIEYYFEYKKFILYIISFLLIPNFFLLIKRFRDVGLSPLWLILIFFIMVLASIHEEFKIITNITQIIIFIITCLPSDTK